MLMTRRDFVKQAAVASAAVPAIAEAAQAPQVAQTKEKVNPQPVRVGMTDWNLGQRGDIGKIALAREIGLDGIQVSVQYPDRRDADGAGSEDTGRVPARRARERHPDLLARHRQSGKIAAADAHQSGLRDPARRGGRNRPQPRHQQHPAPDSGRKPHRHEESGAGRHLRRHDEGSGALRGEVRRCRRPGRLDLGRGQHQDPAMPSDPTTSPSTTTPTTSCPA